MAIDHGRIKALFQAAIDREDPAERLEYLDREIGNDTDLRDRLNDLLAVYDRPPAALDRPLYAGYMVTKDFQSINTSEC
jgi:hypothetical protein